MLKLNNMFKLMSKLVGWTVKLTFVSIQFSSLIIKGFTIKAAMQIEKIIIVFGRLITSINYQRQKLNR